MTPGAYVNGPPPAWRKAFKVFFGSLTVTIDGLQLKAFKMLDCENFTCHCK